MEYHILLVEGKSKHLCGPLLTKKQYTYTTVHTRRDALLWLRENSPDLVIVNGHNLRFDPLRFYQTVRENGNPVPLLLLLPAHVQCQEAGATIILRGDPTPRKFYNRVKRLLSLHAGGLLRAGDIVLNVKQRTVTCRGQQHHLTPKQAHLLQVFIQNPGRVLSRSFLMQKVWDTEYVADTRTLEVHIHWLRKAIEEDPSHPVYLTTVRRAGYRFDPPTTD